MDLEQSMRSMFLNLLAKYVDTHNIELTTAEELQIYGCFSDAVIIPVEKFENFRIRNGDKKILLHVVQYVSAEIKCESRGQNRDLPSDHPIKKHYSFIQFCNPNAELSMVSTGIGTFFGVETGSTSKKENAVLEGICKYYHSILFFYKNESRNISCGPQLRMFWRSRLNSSYARHAFWILWEETSSFTWVVHSFSYHGWNCFYILCIILSNLFLNFWCTKIYACGRDFFSLVLATIAWIWWEQVSTITKYKIVDIIGIFSFCSYL